MGQIIFGKTIIISTDVPKRADDPRLIKLVRSTDTIKQTNVLHAKESNEVIRPKWEQGLPYRVPSYTFLNGSWQRFDGKLYSDPHLTKSATDPAKMLRCLTYNVWFDDFN